MDQQNNGRKHEYHAGKFYVCGPLPMNESVIEHLAGSGIPEISINKEEM